MGEGDQGGINTCVGRGGGTKELIRVCVVCKGGEGDKEVIQVCVEVRTKYYLCVWEGDKGGGQGINTCM